MFFRSTVIALVALTVNACGHSAGCGLEPVASGPKTVDVNGEAREYILGVPENYDPNTPHRLILTFHGGTGNMEDTAESGFFYLEPFSEGTTVFVAPQGLDDGLGTGWLNPGGRDINFVDVIVENAMNELCIDQTQVFATGFSFGAAISYALACDRADVFRAVAPISGAQLSGCDGGTTPIAYLGIHGVQDDAVTFDQGEGLRDHYLEVNGCAAKDAPSPEPEAEYIKTEYDCNEGFPVWWIAHGGGHIPRPEGVAAETWTFFTEAV